MQNIEQLLGVWSFKRTLTNNLEPRNSGTVIGDATYIQVVDKKNQLLYRETGIFTTVYGVSVNISNEYFYVFNAYMQTIEKYSSKDGAVFELLYALDHNHTGEHLCINDHYLASYQFTYEEKLTTYNLTYQVCGPLKNYISSTIYIKN